LLKPAGKDADNTKVNEDSFFINMLLNILGDDSYEQHLKDVNNGIQLIIKVAVKSREDSMHNSSGGS